VILDELSDVEAAVRLRACCGSSRWVEGMLALRPFGSARQAAAEADRIWNALSPADWLEAFDHHPRIGERAAAVAQGDTAAAWSSQEQGRVGAADEAVKADLARVNAEYERRFGFIYIVCASGRSAEELLSTARARLANDKDAELRIAAEEQRKIMQLRLKKLLETS
jgi:2-oxo-4-hydroxy-4-carboxy-5-ureidoimidazoline decarboxylase